MWMHNKTSDWIDNLTDEERSKYHKDARKNVMQIKDKLKERRVKILQERRQKMIEKKEKEIQNIEKNVQKKAELTLRVEAFGGLWVSTEEMEIALTKIADKEKVNAVYCQLQFHKTVLNSKAPAGHFLQKSRSTNKSKVDFTLEQMKEHLSQVINDNLVGVRVEYDVMQDQEAGANNTNVTLRPGQERIEDVEIQKDLFHNRIKEARMKRKGNRSKSQLQRYLDNPENLVGKRIQHRVKEDNICDAEWFDAQVLKVDNILPDRLKTKFDVQYDIDGEDETLSFALLADLKGEGPNHI